MAAANPVAIVELVNSHGNQRRYACADGNTISKGIMVFMLDARTVSSAYFSTMAANSIPAGVVAIDKEANDGSSSVSVWTNFIMDARASGAINVGDMVTLAGSNEVRTLSTTSGAHLVQSLIFGKALETASDQELVNIRVNL